MGDHWVDRARRELLARGASGGWWSYRDGGPPAAEPTALAALGLLATAVAPRADGPTARGDARLAEVHRAAAWLAGQQREDGSIPALAGRPTPGWATPGAMLLWGRLEGFEGPRRRARDWLLRLAGRPLTPTAGDRAVLGHDPSLIGWPWVDGTHSWLEPTAMAILALCGEGGRDHPRVRRGLTLIVDRAIPRGGWNYGNKAVFGRALRPQPGPTGIALLALAAGGPADGPAVPPALDYLRGTLPSIRAAISIGWGLLGLKAHRAGPPEADSWLRESYERSTGRPDATVGLGLLLMAAGPGGGLL